MGLLNIMEERDVQIRGYKVRLPLDIYVVASANPEDYTNRGRIITPLKDRFGSQIRTHYPRRLEDEIAIMEAERTSFPVDGFKTSTPGLHEADRGGADPPGPPLHRDQPALRRVGARQHLQLREPPLQRAQARHPRGRDAGDAAAVAISAPSSPRRAARSSSRRSASRARRRCSASSPSAPCSTSSTRASRRRRAGRGGGRLQGGVSHRGLRRDGRRASTSASSATCARSTRRSGGSAPPTPRPWPPRSSSCSRACTSTRSSTRTARPATPATGAEPC